MSQSPPLRWVSAAELRKIFNDGRYWDRARAGEFKEHILKDGHPTSPKAPEPFCTHSQYIAYLDSNGNTVAVCTLWLANWHIARAQTVSDLGRVRQCLAWTVDHALPSGVLAEQIHPYTGEPLSVSPLTWSHATFVEVVHQYVARLNQLSR